MPLCERWIDLHGTCQRHFKYLETDEQDKRYSEFSKGTLPTQGFRNIKPLPGNGNKEKQGRFLLCKAGKIYRESFTQIWVAGRKTAARPKITEIQGWRSRSSRKRKVPAINRGLVVHTCKHMAGYLRKCRNPKPTHDWNEVKRVARYLKETRNYELRFGQFNKNNRLIGFADADWAQDDRKSINGYLFQFFWGWISWTCRKQPYVSLFPTEAE